MFSKSLLLLKAIFFYFLLQQYISIQFLPWNYIHQLLIVKFSITYQKTIYWVVVPMLMSQKQTTREDFDLHAVTCEMTHVRLWNFTTFPLLIPVHSVSVPSPPSPHSYCRMFQMISNVSQCHFTSSPRMSTTISENYNINDKNKHEIIELCLNHD